MRNLTLTFHFHLQGISFSPYIPIVICNPSVQNYSKRYYHEIILRNAFAHESAIIIKNTFMSSSKGDEDDEVFVGPIRHKERCIAVGVEARLKDSHSSGPSLGEEPCWNPLSGDNFEEISKEAQLIVSHLDSSLHGSSTSQNTCMEEAEFTPAAERFKTDSVAKPRLSPIKRETFCIQDSPLKQLPPAIQQRLMKAKGAGASAATATATGKPRQSTSSPIRQPGALPQPKMTLRSKAGLAGPRSVLPSKPTLPAATQTPVKMRPGPPDKNKLQPPTRVSLSCLC